MSAVLNEGSVVVSVPNSLVYQITVAPAGASASAVNVCIGTFSHSTAGVPVVGAAGKSRKVNVIESLVALLQPVTLSTASAQNVTESIVLSVISVATVEPVSSVYQTIVVPGAEVASAVKVCDAKHSSLSFAATGTNGRGLIVTKKSSWSVQLGVVPLSAKI